MKEFNSLHSSFLLMAARNATLVATPHNPAVAVVFAALSLEAFLNEIPELIRTYATSPRLTALAEILNQAEKNRSTLQMKWTLVVYGFTGKAPERGSQPFQDVSLLIDLRNFIVHPRPSAAQLLEIGDNPPEPSRLVKSFVARGVLTVPEHLPGDLAGDNFGYLLKPPVGAWAVATAQAACDFLGSLPKERLLKQMLSAIASSPRRSGSSTA